MDRFQELLWDLGEILSLPLHVDKHHACSLLLDDTLTIQMEMAQDGEFLLVAAFLFEIPPGRFRENVLKESLKFNAIHHPFGTLGFIEKMNTLVLHRFLLAKDLNGERLADFLESFSAEAENWRSNLANGQVAPPEYLKKHGDKSSPYDIPQKSDS